MNRLSGGNVEIRTENRPNPFSILILSQEWEILEGIPSKKRLRGSANGAHNLFTSSRLQG